MAKYTDDFKLQVTNYCFDERRYKRTAKHFNLDHKLV